MTESAPLTYKAAAQGEDDVLQEMRWKAATLELRSHSPRTAIPGPWMRKCGAKWQPMCGYRRIAPKFRSPTS